MAVVVRQYKVSHQLSIRRISIALIVYAIMTHSQPEDQNTLSVIAVRHLKKTTHGTFSLPM